MPNAADQPTDRTKRGTLFILVLAVVIAAGLWYWLTLSEKQVEPETPPTAETTSGADSDAGEPQPVVTGAAQTPDSGTTSAADARQTTDSDPEIPTDVARTTDSGAATPGEEPEVAGSGAAAASGVAQTEDSGAAAASGVARTDDSGAAAASGVAQTDDSGAAAASDVAQTDDSGAAAASGVARTDDSGAAAASGVAQTDDSGTAALSGVAQTEDSGAVAASDVAQTEDSGAAAASGVARTDDSGAAAASDVARTDDSGAAAASGVARTDDSGAAAASDVARTDDSGAAAASGTVQTADTGAAARIDAVRSTDPDATESAQRIAAVEPPATPAGEKLILSPAPESGVERVPVDAPPDTETTGETGLLAALGRTVERLEAAIQEQLSTEPEAESEVDPEADPDSELRVRVTYDDAQEDAARTADSGVVPGTTGDSRTADSGVVPGTTGDSRTADSGVVPGTTGDSRTADSGVVPGTTGDSRTADSGVVPGTTGDSRTADSGVVAGIAGDSRTTDSGVVAGIAGDTRTTDSGVEAGTTGDSRTADSGVVAGIAGDESAPSGAAAPSDVTRTADSAEVEAEAQAEAEAKDYVETLTDTAPQTIPVDKADHFVTQERVVSLVPEDTIESVSVDELAKDETLSADTPITVVREVEQIETAVPEQLIAESGGDLDKPLRVQVTYDDSQGEQGGSGPKVVDPDTVEQITVREALERMLAEPDKPLSVIRTVRYFEVMTLKELLDSGRDDDGFLTVVTRPYRIESATLADLLQRHKAENPDSIFYLHTVQPTDEQGIWGIVHFGLIDNFARGMAIRRGEDIETYTVEIPRHADERLDDQSSSFLGKLIDRKTKDSYVYNYRDNRMGRNPDRIYPGQELVIINFELEELKAIHKHFASS